MATFGLLSLPPARHSLDMERLYSAATWSISMPQALNHLETRAAVMVWAFPWANLVVPIIGHAGPIQDLEPIAIPPIDELGFDQRPAVARGRHEVRRAAELVGVIEADQRLSLHPPMLVGVGPGTGVAFVRQAAVGVAPFGIRRLGH